MIFVKGKYGNYEAFYNIDHFVLLKAAETLPAAPPGKPAIFEVYAVVAYAKESVSIVLRGGFSTLKEAESWLATKAEEWGIVLADPNN